MKTTVEEDLEYTMGSTENTDLLNSTGVSPQQLTETTEHPKNLKRNFNKSLGL